MKSFAIIISFCFTALLSQAQDFDNFISLSWDVNAPLSNRGWIDAVSRQGYQIGYRKIVSDKFMVGADFSRATYNQYQPTVTLENPNGAFTTDYFKYVYSYGLTASGDYLFSAGDKRTVIPYAGLGLGVSMNSFNTFYNAYQDKEDKWGFLVRPRAGILFPFGRKVGATLGVHYDFSTTRSANFGFNNFSNLGAQVGIMFMGN
jgi:hypothetical protein